MPSNYQLKKVYGINLLMYNALHIVQEHKCKICGKKSRLQIDHNHRTGKIRGLLCQSCNVKLHALEQRKPSSFKGELLDRARWYLKNSISVYPLWALYYASKEFAGFPRIMVT
jgi:hypothetical protein